MPGRLTFLGNPSPWLKQVLGSLQQAGSFEIVWENNPAQFLGTSMPRNRVGVLVLEHGAALRENTQALRKSSRAFLILWMGRAFSKEDLLFAQDHRVYRVFENPAAEDSLFLSQLQRALEQAQRLEHYHVLLHSIKTALLQLPGEESDPAIRELKTGLGKLEQFHSQNEFLGESPTGQRETRLPFYQSQELGDALLSVGDLEQTGTLTVRSRDRTGRVDFLQGHPVAAVCGETRSLKAIYRMFLWDEPQYTFTRQEASHTVVSEPLGTSLREICSEGEALRARYLKIRNQLPPAHLHLQINPETLNSGTQLDRSQFSTLSSIIELGKVSQILDYNPLPDTILLESLIDLKKAGLIQVIS